MCVLCVVHGLCGVLSTGCGVVGGCTMWIVWWVGVLREVCGE